MTAATTHRVHADHPALGGHFPGNPIVPGVVLLALVEADARALLGADVQLAALPVAKFLAPVLPQESFTICIEASAELVVTFTIEKPAGSASVTVASGSMRFARSATPATATR